jgi:hypothetical protein
VRVIEVRAKESKEIRWLATNLKLPVREIVALYDRRMSIEEQCARFKRRSLRRQIKMD